MSNIFNEYENKNFLFLINYINQVNLGNCDPYKPRIFEAELLGDDKQNTSPEIVDFILNKNKDISDNLNLLYRDDDGNMMPLMDWGEGLPSFVSHEEKGWLYHILKDPKVDLFLSPHDKKLLLQQLTDYEINNVYDNIYTTQHNQRVYSEDEQKIFRKILSAIVNKSYITLHYKGKDKRYLPYKLIYNSLFDDFSVMAYSVEDNDIVTMYRDDIGVDDIEEASEKYHDSNISYEDFFETILSKHLVSDPIIVEIRDWHENTKGLKKESMGADRFNHLFADIQTISYKQDNGHYISEIYYYDFQHEQMIANLLMLGKYVKVIGPESIVSEIKREIM